MKCNMSMMNIVNTFVTICEILHGIIFSFGHEFQIVPRSELSEGQGQGRSNQLL